MTDRIEPALTSHDLAEWLEEPSGFAMVDLVTFGRSAKGITIGPTYAADGLPFGISTAQIPALIALLIAALPDSDPRKITRETIAALDHVLDEAGIVGLGYSPYTVEDRLRPIRDALESHLPPE